MDKRTHYELEGAALIVASLAVWGCFGLTQHAIELMDTWKAAAPTQAVQNLTAATAEWQAASKAQADSMTAIERDVRAEMWHVDRSLTGLDTTLADAGTAITTLQAQETHVGPLLDSAKNTVVDIQQSTSELTSAIANANGGISDARDFYAANQNNAAQLLANATAGTATGDHMLMTADQVETKATEPYLHPSHNPFKRAWSATEPFLVAGARITAALF